MTVSSAVASLWSPAPTISIRGGFHQLRIHLTVPGGEIIVNRDPSEHHAHEDVYVAIRDAFDAARRQLEDHVRRMRGDTKAHEN